MVSCPLRLEGAWAHGSCHLRLEGAWARWQSRLYYLNRALSTCVAGVASREEGTRRQVKIIDRGNDEGREGDQNIGEIGKPG